MLIVDLSNNNKSENPDFLQLKRSGFAGVYFKLTEGTTFLDHVSEEWVPRALRAQLMVGFYHFFHGAGATEADFFCSHLPKLNASTHFRPALDYETGIANGAAAHAFNQETWKRIGMFPLFYSYQSFAHLCAYQGKPVGAGLWLAAYGRNDGREHAVSVPSPWRSMVAHQFTSRGRTPGVNGPVDISRVLQPAALEVR